MTSEDWNTASAISNIVLCILTFVTLVYTVLTQRENEKERLQNDRRELLNKLEETIREQYKQDQNKIQGLLKDLYIYRRYSIEDISRTHAVVCGGGDNKSLIRSGFFEELKNEKQK